MDRINVSPVAVSGGNYGGGGGGGSGDGGGGGSDAEGTSERHAGRGASNYGDETSPARKIQTQSSAETSGLGDSLQRMHTLSSTETSGYAETIPSPTGPASTGFSAATTAAAAAAAAVGAVGADWAESGGERRRSSAHDEALELTVLGAHSGVTPRISASTSSSTMTNSSQKRCKGRKSSRELSVDSSADGGSYFASGRSTPVAAAGGERRTSAGLLATSGGYDGLYKLNDPAAAAAATGGGAKRKRRTPSYLAEFAPPRSSDEESEKEATDGGLFLGRDTKSTWLEWSQDRRASFKRKLDSIDERQQEMERNRVTTPVRKARKESLMFASQDTDEDTPMAPGLTPGRRGAIGCDGEAPPSPGVLAMRAQRSKQQYAEKDVKLTVLQWRALVAFWEHAIFVRCRYGGIVVGCVAFVIGIVAVAIQDWSRFEGKPLVAMVKLRGQPGYDAPFPTATMRLVRIKRASLRYTTAKNV